MPKQRGHRDSAQKMIKNSVGYEGGYREERRKNIFGEGGGQIFLINHFSWQDSHLGYPVGRFRALKA